MLHLSLLKRFPLFIWLVCRSLQCLLSALTQVVSRLGSLVQSCCWEGGALQTNVTGVCGGTRSVPATLGLPPAHGVCASPSTRLRVQAALQGAGPELHALPRPKPLRFQFSGTPQKPRLSWACVLCLPWPEQLRHPGARRARSPRVQRASSPPGSQPQFLRTARSVAPCVSSGELDSSCDPLGGCQPSRISGSLWLETGSLFAVW